MIDSYGILHRAQPVPGFRKIVDFVVEDPLQRFATPILSYASWWFSRFLEGQDDGDLPDLGRLPGGEAEVENV